MVLKFGHLGNWIRIGKYFLSVVLEKDGDRVRNEEVLRRVKEEEVERMKAKSGRKEG